MFHKKLESQFSTISKNWEKALLKLSTSFSKQKECMRIFKIFSLYKYLIYIYSIHLHLNLSTEEIRRLQMKMFETVKFWQVETRIFHLELKNSQLVDLT